MVDGNENSQANVRIVRGHGGLAAVQIDTTIAHGLIYLQGAHVAEWTPQGFEPVLWMSSHSAYTPGVALRGGIPLCFPWFGTGYDGSHQPNHGWARLAEWEYVGHSFTDDGTAIVELSLDTETLPNVATEDRFTLRLVAKIGASLDVTLTVHNHGQTTQSIEEALHAYWAVADLPSVSIRGLDDAPFLDKTTPTPTPAPAAAFPILAGQEIDRIYEKPTDVTIIDPTGGRSIHLTSHDGAQTVAWNPGAEKVLGIGDFGDDEWIQVVAIEAVNAREHTISLTPGASHALTLHADVEHL